MRFIYHLATASGLAFATSAAARSHGAEKRLLVARTAADLSVVSLPFRSTSGLSVDPRLRRRDGPVLASLENLSTVYIVEVTLGTPPQSFKLHIDTGSSDLWVNSPSSSLCSVSTTQCAQSGTYVANSSSTFALVGNYFNISYVDGSGAQGDYATDTFSIGHTAVPLLQFGIGYESTVGQGILGIGYAINEVQVSSAHMSPYDNLPAKLAADGIINSNAFSLFLDDLNASTGSVLFGGIDTEQFEGTLSTLPIQTEAGYYAEFILTVTGISLGTTVLGSELRLPVLLDSGSSLTYLPPDMATAAFNLVAAEFDDQQGVAFVSCLLAKQATSLNVSFSGPSVSVPMSELVLPVKDDRGRPLRFSDGSNACLFGIAPARNTVTVLGDTFLRSAYVVYDLENNQISIAQSRFTSTTSNILEIKAGSSGVPSATAVANPVSATGTTSFAGNRNSAAASISLPSGHLLASIAVLSSSLVSYLLL